MNGSVKDAKQTGSLQNTYIPKQDVNGSSSA